MKIFNKALITGASSGIGEALARLFAKKGISLILSGRNEQKLQKLKEELSNDVVIEIVIADLKEKTGRLKLISKIQEGNIDLLINNAGFGINGKALSHLTNELLEIVEVNAVATLELTLEAAHSFLKFKKKGVILNVSSVAGFYVIPNLVVYSATKTFVNSFSEGLDYELKKNGIRVLTSCPGKVNTMFSTRASWGQEKPPVDQFVMKVDYAANEIWNQIISETSIHIFDWRYRFATYLCFFIPKKLIFIVTSYFTKKY